MYRRLLILIIAFLMAIAFPVVVLANQQPISGTPTWQNVPNLGEEYGYYWTDTSGNTIFVICDQTTGEPTSIYAETTTASTGYKTETTTQTSTSYNIEDICPPDLFYFAYPAGDSQDSAGPSSTFVQTTPVAGDSSNDWYGAFQLMNFSGYTENASFHGNVDSHGVSTTVTIPPGTWYVQVPVDSYSDDMMSDVSVNYVVASDGSQCPIFSGTYSEYAVSSYYALDMLPYPGYHVSGNGNLGMVTQGFVNEQKFVPIQNSVVGELQTYSTPAEILTLQNVDPPYVEMKDSSNNTKINVTGFNFGSADSYWHSFSGNINCTFVNDTPLTVTTTSQATCALSGSIPSAEVGYNKIASSTIYVPSGIVIPPNSSVQINCGIGGSTEVYLVPGETYQASLMYDTEMYDRDWYDVPYAFSGSEVLTSPNGDPWTFYAYYSQGDGHGTYGDFPVCGTLSCTGSPIIDGGGTPSTTLNIGVAF